MMDQLLRDIILGLSAFAAGVAFYLAYLNILAALHGVEYAWPFAFSRIGQAGIILLVAEAVFGAPTVSLTWRSVLYALFLLLVFVGFIGIAVKERQDRMRRHRTNTSNTAAVSAASILVLSLVLTWSTARTEAAEPNALRALAHRVAVLEHRVDRLERSQIRFRNYVSGRVVHWTRRNLERQAHAITPGPAPTPNVDPIPSPPGEIIPTETPTSEPTEIPLPIPTPTCVPLVCPEGGNG